ncbi:MAG: hypothetical protein Q8936_15895 [Bacillota bacterium]|nr:hypothetical protein [Bacillota bacterium]
MNKKIKLAIGTISAIGIICLFQFYNFKVFATNSTKDLINITPYVQPTPKDFKKIDKKSPLPLDLTPYNGSIEEVKSFVKKSFTTSVVVPDELKDAYKNSSVGTPQFIKSNNSITNKAYDYYIVPLIENNQIVGTCTVIVYDGQLTIGSISQHGLIEDSAFNNEVNSIREKIKKDASESPNKTNGGSLWYN